MSLLSRYPRTALIISCFFWGCSFTWGKDLTTRVASNLTGVAAAIAAPGAILAIRFLVALILMIILFPSCRRGWSRASVTRGVMLGLLLSVSIMLQYVGLLYTSEAVSAFFTSLAVVFIPLIAPPESGRFSLSLWLGIALAILGISLMTGGTPAGFSIGELLSLLCSVSYAWYIVWIDGIKPEESMQILVFQFFTAGIGCLCVTLAFTNYNDIANIFQSACQRQSMVDLSMLILFSTVIAFFFLNRCQPLIEPVQAGFIYLTEPVFAAIWAWTVAGHGLTPSGITGACLILMASALADLWSGGCLPGTCPDK